VKFILIISKEKPKPVAGKDFGVTYLISNLRLWKKVCIFVYFRSFNFPAFRPSPPEIKRPSPIGGVFLISAFDWIRNRSIVVIGCIYPTFIYVLVIRQDFQGLQVEHTHVFNENYSL
jgi:hypothetical protein